MILLARTTEKTAMMSERQRNTPRAAFWEARMHAVWRTMMGMPATVGGMEGKGRRVRVSYMVIGFRGSGVRTHALMMSVRALSPVASPVMAT